MPDDDEENGGEENGGEENGGDGDGGAQDDGGYELVASDEACDVCAAMEGVYAEPPDVPVHEGCQCEVVARDGGRDDDCEIEIRDVESDIEEYTVTLQGAEFTNCDAPEVDAEFGIGEAELPDEFSHVEPGMEDHVDASRDVDPDAVTIPANTYGVVWYTVTMESRLYKAERWRVCTQEDPVAGVHVTETYLGDTGAYIEAPSDVEVEIDAEPCD